MGDRGDWGVRGDRGDRGDLGDLDDLGERRPKRREDVDADFLSIGEETREWSSSDETLKSEGYNLTSNIPVRRDKNGIMCC